MKVLKAPFQLLVFAIAFLIMLTSTFAFGEVIEDISSKSPSLGSEVTVFGSNLNAPNIVAIIYEAGTDPIINPNVIHYPAAKEGYPKATDYKFTLGKGEGASLQAGKTYVFSFFEDPSLSDTSIQFSIPSTGSNAGCNETDPYNVLDIKGVATSKRGDSVETKSDYCGEDGLTLNQVECGTGYDIGINPTTCEFGCRDGVCLSKPKEDLSLVCRDNDLKDDVYVYGEATFGLKAQNDYCGEDDQTLYQVKCGGEGMIYSEGVKCPGACVNGVCARMSGLNSPKKEELVCEDQDPGNDPYQFGLLTFGGKGMDRDICDGHTIYQPSCGADGAVLYHGYECPFGCKEGACVAQDPQSVFSRVLSVLGKSSGDYLREYDETPVDQGGKLLEKAYLSGELDFKDVNSADWYFPFIKRVHEAGVVNGRTDHQGLHLGLFDPSGQLNAAEAHKFVLQATGHSIQPSAADESWFKPYFKAAQELRFSSRDYPASKLVTRGDVACMIAEGLKLEKIDIPSDFQFTDIQPGHTQFKCLGALLKAGIMSGDSNGKTLRPDGLVNRAEMSKMINLALDQVHLSAIPHCPKSAETDNLRIYNLEAQPVYADAQKTKIKETKDGQYYVQVSAWIQHFHHTHILNHVELSLFRHDLVSLGSGNYREILKQVRVPYAWENATIRPGRIERFTAEIPVPKTPHLTDSSYADPYSYVDFTLTVDLPGNRIKESLDAADNIATARSVLIKGSADDASNPSITQRQIQSESLQASYSSSQKPLGAETVTINLGDSQTGIMAATAYEPYRNATLSDVEFPSYDTQSLNPYQSYEEVLIKYFRQKSTAGLDTLSAGCVDFKPVSLAIKERKVHEDGRLEVEISGTVEKTGAMALISSGVRHRVMMKEKNSNKPWREIWSLPHDSNEDGSKDPFRETFSAITLIKVSEAEVEFKLVADAYGRLAERFENNNELQIRKNLSQFTAAKAKLCTFDFLKHQDIWVMGLGATKKSPQTVELEVQLQNASGKDLKGVKLSTFRHEVDSKKDFIIHELAVREFQSVDLPVGRIKNIKAEVTVPTALPSMLFDGKELGYYFTVAADLGENKIEEIDEIGNNIASAFAPMQKVFSASDYQAVTLDKMKSAGGGVKEIGQTAFGWRNWMQYFQSKHKVPVIGTGYQGLHQQCTTLTQESPAVVQQLKSANASQLKYHVEFKINKKGTIPVPEGIAIASLDYRPSSSASWTPVYRWEDYRLPGDDGLRAHADDILTADVEFIAQDAQKGEFRLTLDPNQVVPVTDRRAHQTTYPIAPNTAGKVDLSVHAVDIQFDDLRLLKSASHPAVRMEYKISNQGTDDVNTPFSMTVKNKESGKILKTITVPYVKNGAYSSFDLIEIDSRLKPDYEFEIEVDSQKDIILDSKRGNNTASVKWKTRLMNDQAVEMKVGPDRAMAHLPGWIAIPLTYQFLNLNDTGQAYYDNKQAFPLSPPLKQEYTKHKPHFSGNGYHQFIWKTIQYLEDYYEPFLALKGGIIELSCQKNCQDTIKGMIRMEVNQKASKTIYVPLGVSDMMKNKTQYISDSPSESRFIANTKKSEDYWRYDPFQQAKNLRLAEYSHDLWLEPGGGKNSYLIYTYLSRGWASFLTAEEELQSGTWWGPLFEIFYYGRTAFGAYSDDIPSNNYQIFRVDVDGAKVVSVKEISVNAAYGLTKSRLPSYGEHFKEFIDFYYKGN